jgi:excisionase family DNA binding protein
VTVVNKTTNAVTNESRKFLSLRDAATEIGATRRFLERRIEDGEIAVFRPSRRLVRVSRAELDRWIESYSHGGSRTPKGGEAA